MMNATPICKKLSLVAFLALLVARPAWAYLNEAPVLTWYVSTGSTNAWWFSSVDNWLCQTNHKDKGYVTYPSRFPTAGDHVWIGTNAKQSPWVYLEKGDSVSVLGLNIGFGNWSGDRSLLEVRTGAYVRVSGNINTTWEGLRLSNSTHSNGRLWINGGVVDASGANFSGCDKDCSTGLQIDHGGIFTNSYFTAGSDAPATITVDDGTIWCEGNFSIGRNTRMTVSSKSHIRFGCVSSVAGGGLFSMTDSFANTLPSNWAANSPTFSMAAVASQTNGFYLTNSTFVVYKPEWDNGQSATYPEGQWGYRWAHWSRIEFKGEGYSEIIQKDSVVTNVGVWFRISKDANLRPSRYVVDGGDLYVHNLNTESQPVPGGLASMGFAAGNDAPRSGTIEILNNAKVSYPGVNTNLVISGNVTALKHEITTNRPHFAFILTKKGMTPIQIRRQSEIMGMFSFVPQGGLQVVQTNRFPLIRHKTASETLTTCCEEKFRAPNAALWTTGGFSDNPQTKNEWGVTLKPSAEIASGADLGAGVSCGSVKIPGKWRDELKSGTVRLKMAPCAKTLAEIAADLTAAGYPATVENTDEVVVDLKASGLLQPGRDNRILFDFTEPQNAAEVRDNIVTTNAVVLKATAECARSGIAIVVK